MPISQGVSIIVCCYNASSRIERTIEHLQKQVVPENIFWEIVVVDNASTDNTIDKVRVVWGQKPVTNFKIVKEHRPGLNYARIKGFEEANYSIVSFVDDDNWIEASWVEKVYTIFKKHENVGACAGQNVPVFEKEPPDWFPIFKACYATGVMYFNEGVIDNSVKGNLWGAGLSIRKEIYLQLKELNFSFITTDRKGNSLTCGGDTELCYAVRILGYDLYHETSLTLQHFIPEYRLNWEYLKSLNYEFGRLDIKARPYFTFYHKMPFKPWYILARNSLIMYLRYLLLKKVTKHQRDKWRYTIKSMLWKGKLDEILSEKESARELAYNQLHQTFQPMLKKREVNNELTFDLS